MFGRLGDAVGLLRQQEQLLMISVSTVLVMAGQGVIVPVLPLFARELGLGTAAVGLTMSSFAFARLLLNVPLGMLADRRGRRLLLVTGPAVTAIGMVGSGLAVGIADLLAWRFVAGAGSAMYMTGAQIYLVDISTPDNRARFIGTNQGALLLGVAIGPGVGGLVAEWFGLRAPFHVVGVAALVATAYAWARLPETRHLAAQQAAAAPPPAVAGRGWARLLRSPDFAAVCLVVMAIFFTRTASRMTLMPLLADSRLGMSPGELGVLFTVMAVLNLALIAPAALAADHFGRKWTIVPSGLAVAVSLVLLALAGDTVAFVAAAMLLALSTGIVGPAPAAYVADVAPADLRGLAMGLYRSAGDVGFVIGPPLLGVVADATSLGWGLVGNAALVAVVTVLFAVVAAETAGRGAAPPPAPAATTPPPTEERASPAKRH